jgi:hypothetical protein
VTCRRRRGAPVRAGCNSIRLTQGCHGARVLATEVREEPPRRRLDGVVELMM